MRTLVAAVEKNRQNALKPRKHQNPKNTEKDSQPVELVRQGVMGRLWWMIKPRTIFEGLSKTPAKFDVRPIPYTLSRKS
jgi:hypothetical protein